MFENEAVSRVLPMNARTVLPTAWSNRRKKWSIKKNLIDLIPQIAGTMFNIPTLNYNYIRRLSNYFTILICFFLKNALLKEAPPR